MKTFRTQKAASTTNARRCRVTDRYQTSSDGNNLFLGNSLTMVSMCNHTFTSHALSAGSSLSAAINMIGVFVDKKFAIARASISGRVHLIPAETRRRIVAPNPHRQCRALSEGL
ncbi:MAG: hypothetical protein ACAH88_09620 [Roseimicrobium sp.]